MVKLLAIAFALFSAPAAALAACTVTDPSGSAVRLRDAPNGTPIAEIELGTAVNVETEGFDSLGRVWVYVGNGWLIKENVSCE